MLIEKTVYELTDQPSDSIQASKYPRAVAKVEVEPYRIRFVNMEGHVLLDQSLEEHFWRWVAQG